MSSETNLFDLLQKIGSNLPTERATAAETDNSESEVTSYVETVGVEEKSSNKDSNSTTPVTIENLFVHPGTHPIVLDLALLKKYGADWLGWESETLELRVPHDFKVKEISHLNLSKIQAIKTVHLIDAYWQRWEVFLWCTMPLNGVLPDFEVMQVPTVSQCMVSVDTANRVRDDVPWSEEVKKYIGTVCAHDGVFCTVAPLDFVSIDSEGIDTSDVLRRWPEVRRENKALSPTSKENVQLNLLLAEYSRFREYQDTIKEQIRLVDHV